VKGNGSQDLLASGWAGETTNGNQGPGGSPVHNQPPPQAAANPWDLSGLDPMAGAAQPMNTGARPKKIVESLLGEHSNLVNLDNLVQPKPATVAAKNPFADQPNPFQAAAAPKPTMNQLMTGGQVPNTAVGSAWPENSKPPSNNSDINPFF